MGYIPRIVAFICTRSENFSDTTKKLIEYYTCSNMEVKMIIGAKSIFSGYHHAVKEANLHPDDIAIFCHDDLEILSHAPAFKEALLNNLKGDTGFIGVAGTTYLEPNCVWWSHDLWKQGKHSGLVFHGSTRTKLSATYYGDYREVVVLDGLFLACKAGILSKEVSLLKPSYFEGNWDFYDIHYTFTAHTKGLKNKTVPILLSHESFGELAGRDSWHKNRVAFRDYHFGDLPRSIK